MEPLHLYMGSSWRRFDGKLWSWASLQVLLPHGHVYTLLGQIILLFSHFSLKCNDFHRSHIGSNNCLNCSIKVVYYIFTSTPGVVRIHFWANPRIQVFLENQFFSFCRAPKNFFGPQIPYLALETPTLRGVKLLKLFDLSIVLGIRNLQNSHFWAKSARDISKTAAWLKKF